MCRRYEQDIKLPLYVAGAGVPIGGIAAPTSSVDIAPTLLELAGAVVPAYMDGRSFASTIGHATAAATPPRTDVLIEYWSEGNEFYTVSAGSPDHVGPCWPHGQNSSFRVQFEAAENTFACVRTIAPDPSLYCEYYTLTAEPYGHINVSAGAVPYERVYHAMGKGGDPWQLANGFEHLTNAERQAFQARLNALKTCAGTGCHQ